MKPYQDTKDSGVPWLSKVPRDWDVVRPRFIFRDRKEKSTASDIHLTPSQKYGVLPQTEYMKISGNRVVLNLTGSDKMKHVEAGDFVIHLRSFQGGIEYSPYSGKVSNAYTILARTRKIQQGYFRYALKSTGFISDLASTTDQMRDGQSIKFSTFDLVKLAVPEYETQKRIADYLDEETAKIDTLISKQERLLKLLEEKRRATIIQVITRGLNKSKLKKSNIEWLGDIPEEWSIKPLFSFVDENKRSNKGMVNDNVLTLSYGKIKVKNIDNGGLMPESFETYQIIMPGDIVMRLTDLQNDHKSLRVGHSDHEGIITSAYVSISSKHYYSKYLYYMLHAYDLMKVFYNLGGGLRQGMKYSDVKRLPAIDIDDTEQRRIVTFLEDYELKVDKTFEKTRVQIELLKERKVSLIANVVTGKVRV